MDNCPNLEKLALGWEHSAEFGHILSPLAMIYLCHNLTPKIVELDLEQQVYFNDICLEALAKRCNKLEALELSGTAVTYRGLVENSSRLNALKYLKLPEAVAKTLGCDYPFKINLKRVQKLWPMKNLNYLITEDDFDFGDIEGFGDYFMDEYWSYEDDDINESYVERQKENLKKATEGFPNLVQFEPRNDNFAFDLSIAIVDSSGFTKVNVFHPFSK